jgi:ATP-dependent Clp protease ATP-binding subunit ClpC
LPVGQGDEGDGQIPFTPRAKKVLELALREALSLGHTIGTEHILLGLVRENEVAARILPTSTPTPRRSATRSSGCSPTGSAPTGRLRRRAAGQVEELEASQFGRNRRSPRPRPSSTPWSAVKRRSSA